MRQYKPFVAGAMVAVLALAGCSAPEAAGSEEVQDGFLAVADDSLAEGGTLRVALDYDSVETNGLDPQTADTARSWMLMNLSYDTLVGIDENFQPVPGIATKWEEVSPTEYVFTLRDDVVFSNGRAMTTDDIIGSIERLKKSESPWAGQVAAVDNVEATGEHEVTFHLSKPFTPLMGVLAHVSTSVLPMAEIEAGETDPKSEMLGTGAYVATSHVQDESWTFEKNPEYFDADTLGVDALEISIAADESSRLAAIRDGSADYAFFNSPDAADLLTGTGEARVVNQQNTDFFYAILNSQDPDSPLADERVRFAVNAAIDRAQLSELALAGNAHATGVTPASLPDACKPEDLPSAVLSDDDIRDLLAEAGAEDLTLSLVTWNSEVGPGAIAQVIQQRLAEFGITVELDIVDDGVWSEAAYGDPEKPMTHDIGISWYAGYGDASLATNWWDTDTSAFTARFMEGTPEINSLVVEGAQAESGSERAGVLTSLCGAVDKASEMVPLVNRPGVIAYRTDKVSPTINTDEGYGDILRYISDFRMSGAE